MLTHLRIQNIGLISACDLSFKAGFSVITGETGAGKSMLIDALSLAIGARSSSSFIRHGANSASVEATFDVSAHPDFLAELDELDIEVDDGEVVFRRTLEEEKSKCFVNGVRLTQTQMRGLGETLVDIHGQYDHQQILRSNRHAFMLDHFSRLDAEKSAVEESYKNYKKLKKALQEKQGLIDRRLDEEALLRAYVEELESLNYMPGEEQELEAERTRLMSSEKLISCINTALEALGENGSVVERFSQAEKVLTPLLSLNDHALESLYERLSNLSLETVELVNDIEKLGSSFDVEPERLIFVDERLFELKDIARKHRIEMSELPDFLAQMQQKLEALAHLTEDMTQLEKDVSKAWDAFKAACADLTSARTKGAEILSNAIETSLKGLEMPNTRFKVDLQEQEEDQWNASGAEKVEFMVATNAGAPLSPLVKVASGGEVSRLMLALKKVFYAKMPRTTLVFDEVDTGVGGKVADAMGEALKEISAHHQVFSITHLAQVASKGQMHIKIEKSQTDETTQTHLHFLSADERLEEVARMLAGREVTEHARAAAKSLLAS